MKPAPDLGARPAREESPPTPVREAFPRAGYAWYVVAVLTLAYILSFIDRQILNLMVDPIRHDLQIGEKRMSLLMGASFAVFYTFFGIPLGRLADTRSRRALVAVGIALWSVMTAGCGVARQFWQLALLRMGVGVGEASLSPAAYSLIADYFPPRVRSTAISVYSMGIYVGSGLAFIVGGLVIAFAGGKERLVLPLVGAVAPWQSVFLLVGLPGLLVSLLLLTVREPARRDQHRAESQHGVLPAASIRETWTYARSDLSTYFYMYGGTALLALEGYGGSSWIPSLFIRRHGWSQGRTGLLFGLIVATCGTLGIVTGGRLADGLRKRGHDDADLRVALFAALAWLPFGLLYPVAATPHWVAIFLAPAIFFMSMPFGVAPAAIQLILPSTMRAQASAVYLFVINLIGMGLGPTLVAALTEDWFADKTRVGESLLFVGAAAHVCGALLLWRGLRPFRRSLDHLREWSQAHA
jgi:MFS family permease